MGDRGSASTSNDIENLCKVLLNEVPDSMETTLRKETCIYNVPANIPQSKRAAYTPQVICIGPIHHKNENELKRRYVNQFFSRLRGGKWEPFQEELANTVKKCAAEISHYYEDDSLELFKDPKELLKMIVWDAAFILELFLKTGEYKKYKNSPEKTSQDDDRYNYDYIIGKPWLTDAVQRDLILLENQLPFCILDELHKIAAKFIKPDCSCSQCIRFHVPDCDCFRCNQDPKPDCSCFQCIRFHKPGHNRDHKPDCICFLELSCKYFEKYNKKKTNPPKILHFTDLVRFFLSSEHPTAILKDTITYCDTATRLEEAGMEFKLPLKDECLLNIKAWSGDSGGNSIKKGELHVPLLVIDDNTECLLRNLMALEQCHFPKEAYICQYVKFLDLLVDTAEDADLLIKSKVIINSLGKSADVAELINELCKGIVEVSSCYSLLAKELDKYSASLYNKSKAFLRRQYFRNVWIGTGTVVGLFVLFITLQDFVRSFF
jgi:hypothetical protein